MIEGTVPAPPPSPEPVLPGLPAALPGFDPAEVRLRFQDLPELFAEVAQEFLAGHAGCADRMRALLVAGDAQQAGRLAHSLKGVAGNIGAKSLAGAAQALMVAVHRKETETRLLELMAAVAAELGPVLASCRSLGTGREPLPPCPPGEPGSETAISADHRMAARRTCQELARLIRGCNLRAEEVSATLAEALAGTPLADGCGEVAAALSRFDFRAAGAALDRLVHRLG